MKWLSLLRKRDKSPTLLATIGSVNYVNDYVILAYLLARKQWLNYFPKKVLDFGIDFRPTQKKKKLKCSLHILETSFRLIVPLAEVIK